MLTFTISTPSILAMVVLPLLHLQDSTEETRDLAQLATLTTQESQNSTNQESLERTIDFSRTTSIAKIETAQVSATAEESLPTTHQRL